MLETKTSPVEVDTTGGKPKQHIVERISPFGVVPPLYSKKALCGAEVSEVMIEHSGSICQECVDEQRKRRPE